MELGVQGRQKTSYLTTQERQDSPRVSYDFSLTVEPLDGTDQVYVTRLWTVDKLNASSRTIPSEQDTRQWPHLRDIKLPSINEKEVRLIIGSNIPDAFWVLQERPVTEENHTPYIYVLAGHSWAQWKGAMAKTII